MSLENEGAKEARKAIKRFQVHMNSPRLVPEQCYRMSSTSYTLVCYVNQITGLFLSKNYYVIPIFLERAYNELDKAKLEPVSEQYRNLVKHYLSHVAKFIVSFDCLNASEAHIIDYIPKVLLEINPIELPEKLILSGEC
jgi:hypothetical protein